MFFVILLCGVSYVIYITVIKPSLYWRNRNVVHVKPWSGILSVFFGNRSFVETTIDLYNKYSDRRYYGGYQFFSPVLFVRDVDLIKQITVKDFDHFTDHMGISNANSDRLFTLNLFMLKGDKWRDMRATLSPAFTGSKMRSMYTLIQENAERFTEYFLEKDEEIIELEMKNIFTRYTNDVIANCAFGITCDSLKDESNEFFTIGTLFSTTRPLMVLKSILQALLPKVFEFFRLSIFPSHVIDFFRKIIKDTIFLREKENVIRPDLIHLLMEAKKGRLKHDNEKGFDEDTGFATVQESSIGKSVSKMEITDDIMVAQALIFFLAGFDTTSTLLSFLFYELALNPDIQTKLQNELDKALKRSSGKVSYEDIPKMRYLDQVVSEALRKHTPGFLLTRSCTKDYKIEAKQSNETDLVLEKGSSVIIPTAGIHMDPKYFPEPNKFDPERFNEENKVKIVAGSYFPFGSGPRNCIGSRFALLEIKALAVSVLYKFDVVPIKRTQIPMKLAKTFNLSIKGGFWLGFKKRLSET